MATIGNGTYIPAKEGVISPRHFYRLRPILRTKNAALRPKNSSFRAPLLQFPPVTQIRPGIEILILKYLLIYRIICRFLTYPPIFSLTGPRLSDKIAEIAE